MGWGASVYAQANQLTLTVTPPLIQITLEPGESWASGIEVVNSNAYALSVGAEVAPFAPTGEAGRVRFLPPETFGTSSAATSWITLPTEPRVIPAGKTVTLPLSIAVPHDADPGGHYAAILIGNSAPRAAGGESALSVTGSIASLIFLRVAGNVVEAGRIRDFVTEKSLYDTAEARLSLRFENQGNVHIQPRGDITIYNMFGKKRGYIPINQEGRYGNVLPGSIRMFSYSWSSDTGEWDFGRYRAEATLGYGADTTQYAQATTYFYVLPIVPILKALAVVAAFVLVLGWAIRAYIRHALALGQGERHHDSTTPQSADMPHQKTIGTKRLSVQTLLLPVRAAVAPRTTPSTPRSAAGRPQHVVRIFFHTYRVFFAVVVFIALCWLAASAYFEDVLTYERTYQVVEEHDGAATSSVR